MRKIIIGSTAIKHYYPDLPRDPKDLDYATKEVVKSPSKDIEYLCNPIIFNWVEDDVEYLPPALVLTLKMSHLFWDLNWDKHMFDIQFLLDKGVQMVPELFDELYVHWCGYHGNPKRSKLNSTKEDFFSNAVNNDVMEHDDLHLILNPIPIYTRVLADDAEVELDESKFIALTHTEKLDFVREEVMVMAWERYAKSPYPVAYKKMLRKFIRQHVPMFAFRFAVENYKELHNVPFNFIKTIDDGLQRIK